MGRRLDTSRWRHAEQADTLPNAGRKILMRLREKLRSGLVIPAHPLALNVNRKLDERRQRALTRYYIASGAGGVAVGVHTTQFAIREPRVGLYEPVLTLAMDEMRSTDAIRIAGIVGPTAQAV